MSADAILARARATSETLEHARAAGKPAAEIAALQHLYTEAVVETVKATRTVLVCPQPIKRHEFWQLIGSPRELFPLMLAGWSTSTDGDKRARFIAQLDHAKRVGLQDAAERFLSNLGTEDWHTTLLGNLDRRWWEDDA